LQLVEGTDAEELQRWITFTQFDAAEKVAGVTEIYNTVNVRQYAEDEMQAYAEKAFKALEQINLPEESKQYLRDFADGLLVREY
jgi:geranylgeranyl diphosphate synthase type II